MEKILQLFDENQIVVRKTDFRAESLIRITGVFLKNGKHRYRGTFTNERGRQVSAIFNEDELKKIDR